MKVRSSWQVTRSVWHALFMREAVSRTTADRMAWFWMLAEPAAMIIIMVALRTLAVGSGTKILGAEFIAWTIVGLFGFYLFRENMMRAIGSIEANKALFAYRQVKPIDTVLVRCYLEGLLKTFIFLLFVLAGNLLDIKLVPSEPLFALFGWASLWLLGVGFGTALSVMSALIPEIGRVVRLASFPLLVTSGVLFPVNYLPQNVKEIVLLNPIVHGVEILRGYFFYDYRAVADLSLTYLWIWIVAINSLGLILHMKYQMRLKAQ